MKIKDICDLPKKKNCYVSHLPPQGIKGDNWWCRECERVTAFNDALSEISNLEMKLTLDEEKMKEIIFDWVEKNTELKQEIATKEAECSRMNPKIVKLTKQLKDENANVRCEAAWALGNIGIAAKGAVPALEEVLNDKNASVHAMAVWALERIRGEKK